jgi:ubiquinone/menaquinone biosynthesis C-methylase UbiE
MSTIEYWNKHAGPSWVTNQELMEAALKPFGDSLLAEARLSQGERVVDVGCGCGETTLEAARRCGRAQGLDISRPMLARARKRAHEARLDVEFVEADAAEYVPTDGPIDTVVSRFGVMFFESPETAFKNMCRWLKPGGRFLAMCWQSPDMNPWLTLPVDIARRYVEFDELDPNSLAPFSLGDRDGLKGLLESSGFEQVEVTAFRHPVCIRGSLDRVSNFFVDRGPVAEVLLAAGNAARDEAVRALEAAIAARYDGLSAELDAAAWLVCARRRAAPP